MPIAGRQLPHIGKAVISQRVCVAEIFTVVKDPVLLTAATGKLPTKYYGLDINYLPSPIC